MIIGLYLILKPLYTCRRRCPTWSKIMANQELIEQLKTFGLGSVEAKIYLHLLNKQPKTILELARDLALPRTSVYDNSLKLAEKGLIQRIVTFKSQKLEAFPLSILQTRLDKERSKLDELQENLSDLEKHLAQNFVPPANTEVRYYQGDEGFQQMMWNALSAEDEMVGYSTLGRIEIVGQKFSKRWSEEVLERKIKDRVILNPTKEALEYLTKYGAGVYRNQYQTTRLLDKKRLYISGDTTIYNNIFAVGYWKQGEVVGVEIENPELVKTQKSIFEELWKLADPLENYLK